MRIGIVAVVVMALSVAGHSTSSALADDAPSDLDARWAPLLLRYAADPLGNRRALAAAEGEPLDRLPPPVLLALADVRLRSRRWKSAARYCGEVLRREPDGPLADWARLGYAAAALGSGNESEARRHFALVLESGSGGSGLARMAIALLDGALGRFDAAEDGFRRAASSAWGPELRAAAQLGIGLARYWRADHEGARAAFRQLVNADPTGPFADDAEYGAARARWRLGDTAGAVDDLRRLAASPRAGPPGRTSLGVVELTPRSLLRAAFDRYRRGPAGSPEAQVAAALDRDGAALARAALLRLERTTAPSEPHETSPAPAPAVRRAAPSTSAASRPGGRPEAPTGPQVRRVPLFIWVGLLAGVALTVGIWRRSASREARGRRT
jgi:tetratricopeptide (TPR) repeat protein